jgi:hypothetical protein
MMLKRVFLAPPPYPRVSAAAAAASWRPRYLARALTDWHRAPATPRLATSLLRRA